MKRRLLFVVNVDWFFVSHRLPIALEAMRQGYDVHIATGVTSHQSELQQLGITVHPIEVARGSSNVLGIAKLFRQIHNVMRELRPDIVHLVTIKPVLLGGIAARLIGVPSVVAAISGLGYVFLDSGLIAIIRKRLVAFCYRIALGHINLKVIFQNPDDRALLMRLISLPAEKTELIRGSGIDLEKFRYLPVPEGIPVIMMAARLLADKGVREFVGAAKLLHHRHCHVRCCLVGEPDPENPSSISLSELSASIAEGIIEYCGQRRDIDSLMAKAHIVVLPSYREGLPKVLLEAAASGRAVITTNVPGCRDAITPDVTGLLVPAHDDVALANAIEFLLQNPARCLEMGKAGRKLAEQEFGVRDVVAKHLNIYRMLENHEK